MVSSTSVERSHAATSSIEGIHVSKPQAQSSLMNHFSKELIWINSLEWNHILAYGTVERNSLEWKILKLRTHLVRHRETLLMENLTEQFIGVLCVQSYDMSSKVKVPEPSLILNGSVTPTKGIDKPRSQHCVNSNNNLLYVRASKDAQEES